MEDFDNLDEEYVREQISKLRKENYTWTSVGRFFSITRRRIRAYAQRQGIVEPYTMLEDNDETRQIIWDYISKNSNAGEIMLAAYLRGLGYTIRRHVLRSIVKDMDPLGQERRRPRGKTPRVHYNAYGPGYIWHVDTWHKLGLTAGIVVVWLALV
jgi:hypothetical protein